MKNNAKDLCFSLCWGCLLSTVLHHWFCASTTTTTLSPLWLAIFAALLLGSSIFELIVGPSLSAKATWSLDASSVCEWMRIFSCDALALLQILLLYKPKRGWWKSCFKHFRQVFNLFSRSWVSVGSLETDIMAGLYTNSYERKYGYSFSNCYIWLQRWQENKLKPMWESFNMFFEGALLDQW